jgi:pimeloyl-ACP methyl ester carboxylesterase
MTTALELVSTDGTPLVVDSTGSGTPLLLLHGGLGSTRVFDRVLPTLSLRYRCLALGRRGYGRSGTSPTHSFEAEAEDVAAVLASLDEPAHLFGHSSGAVAAATAALADGSRLRSLVLYEPPFPVDRPHSGPWIGAVEDAVARGDNEEAVLIGMRDGIGFSDEQIARLRADPSWAARTALAPAWIREVRSVEALPVGVERFAAVRCSATHWSATSTAGSQPFPSRSRSTIRSTCSTADSNVPPRNSPRTARFCAANWSIRSRPTRRTTSAAISSRSSPGLSNRVNANSTTSSSSVTMSHPPRRIPATEPHRTPVSDGKATVVARVGDCSPERGTFS